MNSESFIMKQSRTQYILRLSPVQLRASVRRRAEMDMKQQQYDSQLFTVRVWLEELANGQTEWRGKVQHVTSGEVRYFRDWATLVRCCNCCVAHELDDHES